MQTPEIDLRKVAILYKPCLAKQHGVIDDPIAFVDRCKDLSSPVSIPWIIVDLKFIPLEKFRLLGDPPSNMCFASGAVNDSKHMSFASSLNDSKWYPYIDEHNAALLNDSYVSAGMASDLDSVVRCYIKGLMVLRVNDMVYEIQYQD